MTNKRITDFRVSWTADHEQYYQGHSIMFSEYTHSGQGCGETLREAFEDALTDLTEQGISLEGTICPRCNDTGKITNPEAIDYNKECGNDYHEDGMLAELTSQVKEPAMLDRDVVKGYCEVQGNHHISHSPCTDECAEDCDGLIDDEDPDCAVCAGEWHYYVNVDVKVEESEDEVEKEGDVIL